MTDMNQMQPISLASPVQTERSDPRRFPFWLGIFLIAAIFGSFLLWAGLTWIDRGVTAPGRVQLETERLTINTTVGGRVEGVYVKENDFVEKGTVLLSLSAKDEAERQAFLNEQLVSNQLEQARRTAVLNDRELIDFGKVDQELVLPSVLQTLKEDQVTLFEAERNSIRQQLEVLGSRRGQIEQGIAGLNARREAIGTQLALVSEELKGMRFLSEKGYVPKTRVLALERAQAGLIGERGQIAAEVAMRQGQIAELEKSMVQIREETTRQASEALNRLKLDMTRIRYELAVVEENISKKVIVSPHDGIVLGQTVFHEGYVVTPATPLMYIVPKDESLIITAKIGSGDVESLYPGMPVEVRVRTTSGLKAARRSPFLLGEVVTVSPDIIEDMRTGESYYEATVKVEPEEWNKLDGVQVLPGMTADMLFKSGQRTVLDFLVSPLSFIFERGMAVP